ncbi:TPA: hypothetical protein LA827_003502 [Clostridium botulinum]|uniref:hypothetical protein n=1 Tax=Clostridium botulinum TaxID=1491 RepID=UPI000A8BF818|nr:hypothetical protein [Clostridium botulinum]HBJ2623694.1 hypothetical protein [Clostridium botulinum]
MIIGIAMLLSFIWLLALINKALRHGSKNCDIKIKLSIKCFEFNFNTIEKNASSDK